MSKRTIRCLSPALLAVAVLLLGAATAVAQHPTGFDLEKMCPQNVASGQSFNCTVSVQNNDTLHRVIDLTLTNTVPFPGTPVGVPGGCRFDFDPTVCDSGTATTILEINPDPHDACGACLPEVAPINCGPGDLVLQDEVRVAGTDEGTTLPVSGTTTNVVLVAPLVCEDNNACTTNTCDEAATSVATACIFTPIVCNDNNACTTDTCDPVLGCLTTPITCNDNNACTTDTCDPLLGCQTTPITCNDNNACTTDICDPLLGCQTTPIVCNDNNACTTDICDPLLGCQTTPITCNDNNACTTDICDPLLGCQTTPITCNDNNPCTDDTCDPVLGCVFTDNATCGEEICRTPGFFGSHGGVEKANSTNITLALLNAFNAANDPDLTICGRTITNTTVGSVNSALEAICVSPKGNSVLQLARQLTAAALNCILTNGGDGVDACVSLTGAVCGGVSIEEIFNACNTACAADSVTAIVDGTEINCIEAIDCFNNGGGSFDPVTGCTGDSGCHDRELDNGCVDFSPPGPAGSPRACNDARKNDVNILLP